MKKSILSTIAAVLALVTSGVAQQELVVIERGNSSYQRTKRPVRLNDNIGVVKFSPTQMFVGEIHFAYERQISKFSSFEIGAGPTISNIALGNVQSHIIDPWGGGYAYETSKLGAFLELGYRYYPLEETEALNRFYVSPVMKFRMKNFGLEDASQLLGPTKGSELNLNFMFNIGYQVWFSKSFSMDFYTGMGIGYQQIQSYYPEQVYVDPNWTYQWRDNSGSGARYVFNLGVKVGIGHK